MAEQQLPVWNSKGAEPPDNLKNEGWQPGVKPPAQYFDWLFNRAYRCLEELQNLSNEKASLEKLGHVKAPTDEQGNLLFPKGELIIEKFETAGTYNWTVPVGVETVYVTLSGAGGGGGGTYVNTNYGGASGGGAGGFAWRQKFEVVPGEIIVISVGAGGEAGVSTTTGDIARETGKAGGVTSFGSKISVGGGAGGVRGSNSTTSVDGGLGGVGAIVGFGDGSRGLANNSYRGGAGGGGFGTLSSGAGGNGNLANGSNGVKGGGGGGAGGRGASGGKGSDGCLYIEYVR